MERRPTSAAALLSCCCSSLFFWRQSRSFSPVFCIPRPSDVAGGRQKHALCAGARRHLPSTLMCSFLTCPPPSDWHQTENFSSGSFAEHQRTIRFDHNICAVAPLLLVTGAAKSSWRAPLTGTGCSPCLSTKVSCWHETTDFLFHFIF